MSLSLSYHFNFSWLFGFLFLLLLFILPLFIYTGYIYTRTRNKRIVLTHTFLDNDLFHDSPFDSSLFCLRRRLTPQTYTPREGKRGRIYQTTKAINRKYPKIQQWRRYFDWAISILTATLLSIHIRCPTVGPVSIVYSPRDPIRFR